MAEFNPDGSLKVAGDLAKIKHDIDYRMTNQRCILVKKVLLSEKPPKKCVLQIAVSDKISNPEFIERLYGYFKENAEVPSKLTRITDKEYEIELGTCFKRCTECCQLIGKFREELDGNVIERKDGCYFERKEFCYEDYFE